MRSDPGVNATVLQVDRAIALLDFIWDEAPILKRLVHTALIQEALEREPVELSDEELQRTMNAFRRSHRLYIGVTNNLPHRLNEHRLGIVAFTARYRIHRLVYRGTAAGGQTSDGRVTSQTTSQ